MQSSGKETMFESRRDAGKKLAEKLADYKGRPVMVIGIPNGGMPIALEVALALGADLDIIISRKIPIPLRPESGFGAVTDDGTVILNQQIVQKLGLTQEQINSQISHVTANVRQRTLLYRGNRPIPIMLGKTVIIVDDGLASGYTMLAAVESVKRRRPKQIIVAVPAAAASAVLEVEKVVDKVVTCFTSNAREFFLADYYQYWHDLTDQEAMSCFQQGLVHHFPPQPHTNGVRFPRARF